MIVAHGHLARLGFELGELSIAPVIASLFDDRACSCEVLACGLGAAFGEAETGEAEVGVGLVEVEAAALGEGACFVEIAAGGSEIAGMRVEGGAGEEAEGEVVLAAGPAQPIDGSFEVGRGQVDIAALVALPSEEMGAAQREVVEADIEDLVFAIRSFERAGGALPYVSMPVTIEQQLAVPEARRPVERGLG